MLMKNRHKIICALDFFFFLHALNVANSISNVVGMVKVGLELYTTTGPLIVSDINHIGIPIFLDLKFHDIPNTVSGAIRNFTKFQNIKMLTVHAQGGENMMKAAVSYAGSIDVIAVTLLTSIRQRNARKKVIEYTEQALNAGARGVVCSPKEVAALREKFGNDFKIVVPGIRPTWYVSSSDDQERKDTPESAIKSGASYIVVGRPITRSTSPVDAAYSINLEINDIIN